MLFGHGFGGSFRWEGPTHRSVMNESIDGADIKSTNGPHVIGGATRRFPIRALSSVLVGLPHPHPWGRCPFLRRGASACPPQLPPRYPPPPHQTPSTRGPEWCPLHSPAITRKGTWHCTHPSCSSSLVICPIFCTGFALLSDIERLGARFGPQLCR